MHTAAEMTLFGNGLELCEGEQRSQGSDDGAGSTGTGITPVVPCGKCDVSEQASHAGELAHAVESGVVGAGDVTALGAVLAGTAEGRRDAEEMTAFDSTGLAIQDLAIALAAVERAGELSGLARLELG